MTLEEIEGYQIVRAIVCSKRTTAGPPAVVRLRLICGMSTSPDRRRLLWQAADVIGRSVTAPAQLLTGH